MFHPRASESSLSGRFVESYQECTLCSVSHLYIVIIFSQVVNLCRDWRSWPLGQSFMVGRTWINYFQPTYFIWFGFTIIFISPRSIIKCNNSLCPLSFANNATASHRPRSHHRSYLSNSFLFIMVILLGIRWNNWSESASMQLITVIIMPYNDYLSIRCRPVCLFNTDAKNRSVIIVYCRCLSVCMWHSRSQTDGPILYAVSLRWFLRLGG